MNLFIKPDTMRILKSRYVWAFLGVWGMLPGAAPLRAQQNLNAEPVKLNFTKNKVTCMRVAPDGAIYMAGHKPADSLSGAKPWLARYAPSGKQIWEKTYLDTLDGRIAKIAFAANGDVLLCGASTPLKQTKNEDFWVARVAQNGNLKWSATISNKKEERASDIIELKDGSIVAVGATNSRTADWDYYILRFQAGGKLIWQLHDGSGKADYATCVAQAPDGTFAVAGGSIAAYGYGMKDLYIARFDTSGQKRYDKVKGGAKDEMALYIDYDKELEAYRVWSTDESQKNYGTLWLTSINTEVKKWGPDARMPQKRMFRLLPLTFTSVAAGLKGGFVIAGHGYNYDDGEDALLAVAADDGELLAMGTWGKGGDEKGICAAEIRPNLYWLIATDKSGAMHLLSLQPEKE